MDRNELCRLLSALCDETAEPEQIVWLDEAIQHDDRTRQMYLEYMALHGEIAHLVAKAPDSPHTSLVDLEAVFAGPAPTELAGEPLIPPVVGPSWGSALDWRTHPVRFYATTFALTLLMWSIWTITLVPRDRGTRNGTPTAASPVQSVARLIRVIDAVWSPDSTPWQEGAWMQPGWQIALDEGVVEVQFASGANVLLAGPVQFYVSNANAGQLNRGRLSAQVPPRRGALSSVRHGRRSPIWARNSTSRWTATIDCFSRSLWGMYN